MKNILRQIRIAYLRMKACSQKSQLPNLSRVLIVAPHPDDEVIGCGGLIARLTEDSRPPHIVIMTGGEQSHNGCCATPADEIIRARRSLTSDAMHILNLPASHIHHLNFRDGQISPTDTQTKELHQLIEALKPDTILIPHHGEGWSDHVTTGEIVKRLIAGNDHIALYEYCVWFWYYNTWDIDWPQACLLRLNAREHALKLQAMDAYVTPPHRAPCGKPWSGVLPRIFINANRWNKELYFKIR